MMSKYLILLLIPGIVYARISIQITAGDDKADTAVQFTGSIAQIISEKERETFGILDRGLKDACEKFAGERPTDVFVKRPTPWEDVYRKFNWDQVQTILKPIKARVISIHTKPVTIATRECNNYLGDTKKICNANLHHQIEETVSNFWTTGGDLTVGKQITYSVNYAAGSIGGTTSISYSASWGNDTSKVKSVTLGSTMGVEVKVPPAKSYLVALSASHCTLEIEVDYQTHLTGDVFANYRHKFRKHMWWAFPLKYVLKAAQMPQYVTSTEKITVGYYTSARVVVRDKDTDAKVKLVPAGVISHLGLEPHYEDSDQSQ